LNLRRRLLKKNGFILAASVILIVFAAIVVEIRQDRVILNDGTYSFEVKLE
jgi:hypothetical protein